MNDLLLYSLAEFREIILPVLELVDARSVVEIGGEGGTFTRELAAWAEARGGAVRCIDPKPSNALVQLAEESPAVEVLRCRSVEALDRMERSDVYLIDGDHNYWTLSHELRAIAGPSGGGDGDDGTAPVLFVHDVGWPAGRRDMYYDPAGLPPEGVHPHEYEEGVTVGCASTVPHGFRGEGEFAWARHEGGPANGVLTAVEDFLAERPELDMRVVPCIFGLAVVFRRESPHAGALVELLDPYAGNPLLERLERNRVALYLRVLEVESALVATERALEDWTLRTRDVEVENRALWARVAELEGRLGVLSARHEA
ncbi:MAG TPA: class I SAM-dependent methyltransferase, partial [Acidimicrobiales bacterium]|nr:class I SAM-dependent methyltransferase [Acidimicrobiales bacterium]